MSRTPVIALYSDSPMLGGAERSLLELVGAYRGRAALVLVSPESAILDEAAARGLDVRRVKVAARVSRGSKCSSVREVLCELRPDLLHINLPNPFAARGAVRAAYSLGIRITTAEHLVLPSRRLRGRLLKRAYSSLLAAQITVGRASARFLVEHYGLRASTVHVIHNGISSLDVEPVEYPERPIVGCAARFEDQKQLDVLIRAMAELPPAVGLVLVGDGTRRDELASLAAALGIADRVTWTGWVADARSHIAGFDVFALPSRNEALPLTVLEAMRAGTPVVATDVGSVADAIEHGATGLLVRSGDVAGLAAAIRRLLDDAELRERLATAARERARADFTADAMAARYDEVWMGAISARARPGERIRRSVGRRATRYSPSVA